MMTIHHIGYLVKNIEKAQEHFKVLGFCPVSEVVYDSYRDVDIIFMEKDGYVIELVSPKSENSVVAKLIKTYKNAPYHICYEVDDMKEELQKLETSGFTRIDEMCPAPALEGRRVCFLFSARMGMIELLEKGSKG